MDIMYMVNGRMLNLELLVSQERNGVFGWLQVLRVGTKVGTSLRSTSLAGLPTKASLTKVGPRARARNARAHVVPPLHVWYDTTTPSRMTTVHPADW